MNNQIFMIGSNTIRYSIKKNNLGKHYACRVGYWVVNILNLILMINYIFLNNDCVRSLVQEEIMDIVRDTYDCILVLNSNIT